MRWTELPTSDQNDQIDRILSKAYSSIVTRLEARHALLDTIVGILEEKQEVSGRELRELLAHA